MTAARQPDFYFSFVGDHSSPRIGGPDQELPVETVAPLLTLAQMISR
jgi:hypothetical protein